MKRALLVFVVALSARVASAAPQFDAQNFSPSSTGNGYLNVDSPFVLGHIAGQAGLYLSYARDPLVLRDADGKIPLGGHLIRDQLGMTLVGSFAVYRRVEIGLTIPFIPYQNTDGSLVPSGKIAAGAVGDLRLDAKFLMYRKNWVGRRSLGFSLIGGLFFPSGSTSAFAGQGGFGARLRLLLGYRDLRGDVSLSLGFVLRESRAFYDLNVTHQATLGLGGRVHIVGGLSAMAEIIAAFAIALPKSAGSIQASEMPVELLAGLKYKTKLGIGVVVAGGGGIGRGFGTPVGRAIVGITYENLGKKVAFVDSKPSSDRETPRPQPEPKPEPPKPEPPPTPPRPEVIDSDGDGVVDSVDNCPQQKGSLENRGCPDIDSDGDGLWDREDKCPFDPENYNGIDDDDGCDDGGGPLVRLSGDAIELLQPINFEQGTLFDTKSFKVLDALGAIVRNHRELTKIRIEGHTDNRGGVVENLDLSRDRASTVRRFLIENHRVDAKRLIAQGFGADRPIADNKTPQGRIKNRRIDVVIVERAQ